MRYLFVALALVAAPVGAQGPALPSPVWDPAASYVTAGQDEPGYRSWYLGAAWRAEQVRTFNTYLQSYQVGGVLPTWQLLRTATAWERCGGQPFEVPPTAEWANIVQTLRYIRDEVIPAVGPVEAVSVYRNPTLNACAGGAPESAHKHYSAIDMVPLRPTTREDLMRTLCAVHGRRGTDFRVGLGFYAFLRFHIDTTKYRRWGTDPSVAQNCPPIIHTEDAGTVGLPIAPPPLPPIVAPPIVAPPAPAAITPALPHR